MDGLHYNLPIGSQVIRNGITLTLTEDGWRAELQHSMMRRCKGWDYCRPWIYLITIGCQHHDEPPMPAGIPVKNSCSRSKSTKPSSGSESTKPSSGRKRLEPGSESTEIITPIPSTWQYPSWLKECYSHQGRPHLFGELAGTEETPVIALNDFGKAVDDQIMAIPASFPKVKIIERIVMPNHIHFVIRVKERLLEKQPLGYIIDRFKSWVNRRYKEIALGLPVNTIMSSCSGSMSTGQNSGSMSTGHSSGSKSTGHGSNNRKLNLVFEENFHDRILFRDGQLANMIDYCRENPLRLWKVVHNSQYFHTLAGLELTMPIVAEGGTAGRGRWNGPVEGLLAPVLSSRSWSDVGYSCSRNKSTEHGSMSAATTTITFNAIGNRSLLAVTERVQIQCSRSMSEEAIAQKTEEVLAQCEHGVIPISPCISPGEKAIARAVMNAGYSLIALFPQGIPDTSYKPYKEYFDACATGQLLLLSPWKYEQGVNHVKRWQCLFLNDIAAQLTII